MGRKSVRNGRRIESIHFATGAIHHHLHITRLQVTPRESSAINIIRDVLIEILRTTEEGIDSPPSSQSRGSSQGSAPQPVQNNTLPISYIRTYSPDELADEVRQSLLINTHC